jgi:hypothetical protein
VHHGVVAANALVGSCIGDRLRTEGDTIASSTGCTWTRGGQGQRDRTDREVTDARLIRGIKRSFAWGECPAARCGPDARRASTGNGSRKDYTIACTTRLIRTCADIDTTGEFREEAVAAPRGCTAIDDRQREHIRSCC